MWLCVSAHPQNVSAPSLSHCLNSAALIRTGLSICVCVCVRLRESEQESKTEAVHVPKSEPQSLYVCVHVPIVPPCGGLQRNIYSIVWFLSTHTQTHTLVHSNDTVLYLETQFHAISTG